MANLTSSRPKLSERKIIEMAEVGLFIMSGKGKKKNNLGYQICYPQTALRVSKMIISKDKKIILAVSKMIISKRDKSVLRFTVKGFAENRTFSVWD